MATRSESDGQHPASHYLVVEDSQKPSTWHLRVRDANGEINPRLLGAAWAALHGGYRGNKYEGPQKQEAINKLRKLYAQVGKNPPTENKAYFHKDKAGQTWFIGIYSNNFEDREKEILSWESHLDYAKWLKKTGIKPPIIAMHLPQYDSVLHLARFLEFGLGGISAEQFNAESMKLYESTAIGQTELVIPMNGFVLVFGKILPNKESVVEIIKSSNVSWGMSHGFIPVVEGDGVIEKYRAFEFTYLPVSIAANEFTTIEIKKEETMVDQLKSLTDEERETIGQIIDLEKLEEGTAEAKRILSRILASKEIENDEAPEEVAEKEAEQQEEEEVAEDKSYDQIRNRIFSDLNVQELKATFDGFAEIINKMSARIETLETQLKQVERTEDEKIASQFQSFNWGAALFKQDEQEQTDDPTLIEALKEKRNGLEAVESQTDDFQPLVEGFWKPFTGA